jgi:septal ring factor EnvC (AmiA/AmiB activator)
MEEEALALSIQNLRIKLSKAEAQLAALKEARATKQNAKAEHCREDDTRLSKGDRVKLSWDRIWNYGKSKKRMSKTDMEGKIGTVERVSECYVWVRLDDTKELYKKRKHNVTRLGGRI